MSENNKIRNTYWDVVKGISIISIVIGHCMPFLSRFVYLYHLAIFIFVGGYLFNNAKYSKEPFTFIGNKLKSNWTKYLIYTILFIILHNILLSLGVYNHEVAIFYSKVDIIKYSINTLFFQHMEPLGGALWFIVVIVFTSILYCFIVHFSNKLKTPFLTHSFRIAIMLIGAFIGVYFVKNNIDVNNQFQKVLLMLPFATLGNYCNKIKKDTFNKLLNPIIGGLAFFALLYIVYKTDYQIEISRNIIGNPVIFYLVSCIGIFFVLVLSKYINLIKYNPFAKIGFYSYDIMALHFCVFKLIDIIYYQWNPSINLSGFPYSVVELWPLYLILGILLPIVFVLIFKRVKNFIVNILVKFQILKV
ncbi:fucose 4-O-acetylase-like acetyltransferase [Breznakia sp. PF5-3]|uniref:acyltransferase family protein n=1 Tax=unclassified Breznakia TaxID=2623764 RepID=UPI0024062440|nr:MULTISPECIES: acyltransferase family protein [unclassified Breznakia]MDF9825622.1 fucose 4-O-acetylase-like acetyltransferase [Breznakia sp. PM6-1]MDF9836435.1 fucose 4-O-acetylase-like acetyltransferase [Breznakia sp. PF5-3]MDF9838972.1 fucose 4-O-acetylase-like acetyltransferase [Breznakia sp. PFB2-8]MDF9860992.1 fucose 4-O-acetylase-like acetyltransferase [Breznakia sp. PH5-24]